MNQDKNYCNELNFTIGEEWRDRTLDCFLKNQAGLSRGRIRALKDGHSILVDYQPVRVTQVLHGGEHLTLDLGTPSPQPWLLPEPIPVTILYEDQDVVVVDKPAGMVVHPVKKYQSGTLANALVAHWQNTETPAAFHPVHRLDRLTSGLVVIAKHAWAHQQLDRQLTAGKLHRLYLGVCHGTPAIDGRISAPIKDDPDSPRRQIAPDGRSAITRYRVLATSASASLLVLKLFTGRTHQIRVHLSFLGHALWGDTLYGSPAEDFPRPALHAVKISFIQPRTGRAIRIRAAIPNDLSELFKRLSLIE